MFGGAQGQPKALDCDLDKCYGQHDMTHLTGFCTVWLSSFHLFSDLTACAVLTQMSVDVE